MRQAVPRGYLALPLAVAKKGSRPGDAWYLTWPGLGCCCPLPLQVLHVDFQEELLKYVAPENLMVKYGGTNATPLIDSPGPWKDEKVCILCRGMRRMQYALTPPGCRAQRCSSGLSPTDAWMPGPPAFWVTAVLTRCCCARCAVLCR